MSGFTAPVGGNSNKLEVEKIPSGMQLCTFYGIADIGTQETNFGDKNQVYLMFEFPQEMRIFWEGDQPKPAAIFNKETLSMHEKANLRKTFIEPMSGKSFTDEEAAKYDMSQLLGKHFVATIRHTPDGKYANIVSITPLDDKNKSMFGLTSLDVPQINNTVYFHKSMGYDNTNFANMPKFLREANMTSKEGLAHKAKGGKFAEPDNNGSNNSAPASKKVIMLPNSQYTYAKLKESNWTDDQIVQNGYGKWDEPVAPPTPQAAPPAPQAPSEPGTPPVSSPQIAPPPSAPAPSVPVLVLKDPSTKLEDWIKQGWTEELLVEHGHASFQ